MGKQADKFAGTVAAATGGLTGTVDGKAVAFDPISLISLITTTIIPMVVQWVQKCRERRQQQQQDTPQQQIAAAHADPRQRERNVSQLQARIMLACDRGRRDEIKRAKTTGLPADLGRYAIDADGAYRLADKLHDRFANMKPADAASLCAECGVT